MDSPDLYSAISNLSVMLSRSIVSIRMTRSVAFSLFIFHYLLPSIVIFYLIISHLHADVKQNLRFVIFPVQFMY